MSKDLHEDLKLFNLLVDELLKQEKEAPVSKSIKTEELQKKIDISLSDNPAIRDEFIKTLEKLILYTPKTATNRFFNQLWGGIITDWKGNKNFNRGEILAACNKILHSKFLKYIKSEI